MARIRLSPQNNIAEKGLTVRGKSLRFDSALAQYTLPGGRAVVRAAVDCGGGKPLGRRPLVWRWLRWVAWLYKITDSSIISCYQSESAGLWLQPRDIFTAAMRGRLAALITERGTLWPLAALEDISMTLDVFSETLGAILYRGADRWRALLPGAAGDTLTIGNDGLPVWSAGSGGAGGVAGGVRGAAELYATGVGSTLDTMPDGRRYIRFLSYSNLTAEAAFSAPLGGGQFVLDAIFACFAADAGVHKLWLALELYSESGGLLASVGADYAQSAWAAGEHRRISSPVLTVPASESLRYLRCVVGRRGANADDTGAQHSHFWLLELRHV